MFVEGMNFAKGHITTENGIIRVEYKKGGGKAVVKAYADEGINAVFEAIAAFILTGGIGTALIKAKLVKS